jgi:GntR family transcriptional regulator/MocR family aminotransferase
MARRLTGISLDSRDSSPLYQQVFEQVVKRVHSCTFPAGYRLPPSRALAEELGVHRNTIVHAYADLESAGFVVSKVGRGTFVATTPASGVEPLQSEVASTRRNALPWSRLIAPQAIAEPLGRFDRLARISRGDVIHLGRMHPSADLLPVDLFQRCLDHALKQHGAKALSYGPREGVPQLRALIAEELGRQGVPATADDLVITNGSQQALDLVVRALVRPGDGFAVDALTYPGMTNVLIGAGARILPISNDDEGPRLSDLERIGGSVKGYYSMPRGHNPLATTISTRRCDALVEWTRQHGVPIIEDDYTAGLSLDDEAPPPALRARDREVIYVGTFSKTLIPALRIGFVVCPPALRPVLISLKHSLDLGNSVLIQLALAEFLERGYFRAHLARILPEYRARREALESAIAAQLPGDVRWRRCAGTLHLWLTLPVGYNAEEVADEARRRGVNVSPSTLYSAESRETVGLRLTFCGESPQRLREGARRLGRALSSLAAKHSSALPADASLGVV